MDKEFMELINDLTEKNEEMCAKYEQLLPAETVIFKVTVVTDAYGRKGIKASVRDPEGFGYFDLSPEVANAIWQAYKDYENDCYVEELMERDD